MNEQRASEQTDTYSMPAHGWTCFHCGDTFRSPASARAHFGETPEREPGCVLKLTAEDRSLLRRLRFIEAANDSLHADLHNETTLSQHHSSATRAELQGFKPFQECSTIQDAFNVYDSMEGRALAAEAALAARKREIGELELVAKSVHDDLLTRAQPNRAGQRVVNLSSTVWMRLCAVVTARNDAAIKPSFKPGDRVRYHPIAGGPHDGAEYQVVDVGSIGSMKNVAWLAGKRGCVSMLALSRVEARGGL